MKRKIILVSLERAYSNMVSAMHLNALYFRRTSMLNGNIHVVSVFYLFMKHVRYYTRLMFHMLKCIQSNLQVRLQVVRFAHQIDLNCQKETEKWVNEMVSIYSNKFQLIIKNYLDMTLGHIRIRSIITCRRWLHLSQLNWHIQKRNHCNQMCQNAICTIF